MTCSFLKFGAVKTHTLLKAVIGFLCLLPIFIIQFGWKSVKRDFKIRMLIIYELGQNWSREGHNFSTFLDEITLTHEPWSLCYWESREVLDKPTYYVRDYSICKVSAWDAITVVKCAGVVYHRLKITSDSTYKFKSWYCPTELLVVYLFKLYILSIIHRFYNKLMPFHAILMCTLCYS